MKKKKFKMTRRQVLKAGLAGGVGMLLPWKFKLPKAFADTQGPGLSNPAIQPKFAALVPNALDPSFFLYKISYSITSVWVNVNGNVWSIEKLKLFTAFISFNNIFFNFSLPPCFVFT